MTDALIVLAILGGFAGILWAGCMIEAAARAYQRWRWSKKIEGRIRQWKRMSSR